MQKIRTFRLRLVTLLLPALLFAGCGDGVTNTPFTPVVPPIKIVTGSQLADGQIGMFYSNQLQFSGGSAPYMVSLASGVLPPGLSLSEPGNLAGTPTTLGSYSFTYTVRDSTNPQLATTGTATVNIDGVLVGVDTSTRLATVPQTGFGIHTSVYDSGLSDVAGLPALLKTGGITMMRYPGGSYSDNYHWAQYVTTPLAASTVPACGAIPNGYLASGSDFGSFVKTLRAVGAQAIITVNYGTSVADANGTRSSGAYGPNTCSEPNTGGQPQEAAAWVAYANGDPSSTQAIGIDAAGFDWKTIGFWAGIRAATPLTVDDGYNFLRLGLTTPIGVQFWEIGNEIYYNGYQPESVETDLHAPYVYPNGYTGTYNSRVGDPALAPAAYGTNAVAYIQAMRAVDPTIKIGLVVSSAIDPVASTWTPAALGAVCASANIDFAILHYYPGAYNAVTGAQLLSAPQGDWPGLVSGIRGNLAQYCPANANTIQIFVTETGSNGTLAPSTPPQINGLFSAHNFLTSLEAGVANMEWLELHNGTYLTAGTEAPGPAYFGIKLAHQLADVGDALVATNSSSPTVLAHASLKANGQKGVLLVNADPVNLVMVQVTISGSTLGTTATQYSYGLATTQTSSTMTGLPVTVTGNKVYVAVPPYTVTELLIQ